MNNTSGVKSTVRQKKKQMCPWKQPKTNRSLKLGDYVIVNYLNQDFQVK